MRSRVRAARERAVRGEATFLPDGGNLIRRAIVERTMWTFRVIVFAPAFQLLPDIGEREENRHVQAFIAEPPIE